MEMTGTNIPLTPMEAQAQEPAKQVCFMLSHI